MTDFTKVDQIQRSQESLEIEDRWHAMRGDDLVPNRTSVTARQISPRLLSQIGICAVDVNSGAASYRLAGTKYRQLTGVELTGGRFEEFIAGQNLESRARLVRAALAVPAGVWWVSTVSFGIGSSTTYQSTILPLKGPDGLADRLLDFIECDIPVMASGMKGILSAEILKRQWIDVGAGVPPD